MESVKSHYIFYYPFSYRKFHFRELVETLNKNHFYLFHVEQQHLHDAHYGPDVKVSLELLKQFYFPFIEEKLLSEVVSPVHFNRFSKVIGESGHLKTKFKFVIY